MAEEHESTAEVAQVIETTEATAEQEEVAIAPVVLPPEPTIPPEEITQVEENTTRPHSVEINVEATIIQEKTRPRAELESAEKDTKHTSISDPEEEDTEGEPKLGSVQSQLELKMKLDRERKQRLKDARTNRFMVPPPAPPAPVHPETEDKVEEEEQEDEDREDAHMEEPPVIDPAVWETIEVQEEESEEEVGRSSRKQQGSRNVGIFAPLRDSAFDDDADIFYMDPKYDTEDLQLRDTISLLSLKSHRSTRSTRSFINDTVQLKADFLRNFEVPDLSDISEEHDPEPMTGLTLITSADSLGLTDHGQFVDPLTGEVLPSSESSSESEMAAQFGIEEQETASPGPQDGSSEISDIPDFPGFPSEVPHHKTVITFDEMVTSFIDAQGRVKFDFEEPDQAQEFVLAKMIQEFVEDLVSKLVTRLDSQRSANVLRLKCDKNKLLAELINVKDQYIFEKYTNGMLTSRLVDYFKRVRNIRVFAKLEPETDVPFTVRYTEALAKVDNLKYHLHLAKHKNALQINKMILDLHSAQSLVSFTETRLERNIRKYLVRPDSDFLRRYVDWVLRQMQTKRNEISDMRLIVINKKQTLGLLKHKIKELETLSSTVSIQDFISIQNEAIALEKKIEERGMELKKMRAQYLTDVHITHHNREKAHALADKLQHMKNILESTVQRQRTLRATLYQQKLERTKIRDTRKELTYQGGILAMPLLMHEYDNTVQQVQDSQKRVSKLRDTLKVLTHRVSLIEGRSL